MQATCATQNVVLRMAPNRTRSSFIFTSLLHRSVAILFLRRSKTCNPAKSPGKVFNDEGPFATSNLIFRCAEKLAGVNSSIKTSRNTRQLHDVLANCESSSRARRGKAGDSEIDTAGRDRLIRPKTKTPSICHVEVARGRASESLLSACSGTLNTLELPCKADASGQSGHRQ